MERESKEQKRYCGRGLLEMSSQKIKTTRTDPKLYPVVVTDMDRIGKIAKRVKLHYMGNSKRYGEWWPCDTRILSSSSLEDRTELVHGELHGEIKRKSKLYSGRKDDPATVS